MSKMVKALGAAAALAMLGTAFVTPGYALDMDTAVEQCALVAAEEQNDDRLEDNRYRGMCIKATSDYLGTLSSSGIAPDVMGAELADYVVQLAQLLDQQLCRPDSEIPQAIAMTGQVAKDPEQAEQIRLISLTVFNCDITTTAAIAATPAFGGGSLLGRGGNPPSPPILVPGTPTGPSASAN